MAEEITFAKVKQNGTTVKKKVPVFRQGTSKEWLQWILRLQEYATFMQYGQDPEDQFAFVEDIQLLLFDEDLNFFNDFVRDEAHLRPDVAIAGLRHLTARHCPAGTRGLLMDELSQLKKAYNKTVRQYSGEFRMILRMIPFLEHGENEPVPEADTVRMFRLGMPINWQVETNRISRIWDLASLEAQFELIERNERDEAILRNSRQPRGDNKQQRNSNRKNSKKDGGNNPRNHGNRDSAKRYCNYCKMDNHNDDRCFRNPESPAYRPRNKPNHGDRRGNSPNTMAAMQEQLAEMAAMMSAMKRRQDEEFAAMRFYSKDGSNTLAAMSPPVAQPPGKGDPKMVVQIQLGKNRVTALLDTGCTSSAMDRATATMAKQDINLRPAAANFLNADGSPGTTTHNAEATFKMLDFSHSRTCSHEFRVASKLLYPVMLGRDFLLQQRMVLDFDRGVIEWDGIETPMTKPPAPKLFQAAVLASDTECRAEINVDEPEEVPLDSMLSESELTHTQKADVMNLVNEFSDLFTSSLGTMKKEPYVLPLTPDAKPIASRPFPIPRAYYDATRAEIQRLIDIGVLVRDSTSLWASPAFVVPKKDGSVRLVCDFRKLNQFLQRNHYPTKDVKEMVRSVEQPKYKSVFDVPLSYYTRVLARKSRAATAITTPLGKFVFARLPMGVSTAPDEFQACMDEKLGDLEYVRVYLDDIMVTSSSFAEHLEHLAVVFHRLRDFGLTLHRKKSKICAKVVEYLGYQLTEDGIAALPNKVAAITAIAPPRNRREVRRFVGMVNFYGDMIPRRAELLAPLTRLTSPTRTFQWTSAESEAFEAVKSALAKRVLLAFPASGRPFHVFTDASKLQLGAVITQDKKPLAYWSKKCNHAQTAYPANRLELLSILLLLREFRSMLLGQELHLHTDHLNLTYSTFHDVHMMRWRLEIEEFGPIFHYIPGTSNVVADALSRLPIKDEDRSELEEKAPPPTIAALAEAVVNESCPVDMRVVAARQADDPTLVETDVHEIAGTVVKVHPITKKVLVPTQLQQQLVQTYHDLLIHPGAATMKNTIAQVFHWDGMETDIRKFVDKCITCLKAKHPTTRYGLLPPKTVEVWPWYEIAVDSIGPYGKKGFRALTIIDTSTRLVEILPALDATSAEAAYLMDRYWFARYPRPARCVHDGGSEFKMEFAELLDSYGVERIVTTTRNPQANAVIERVHRVIGEKMRTKSITTADDWANFLNNTMFAMRASNHSMLKASPAQLAFGRDMLVDMAHKTNWAAEHQRKVDQVRAHNKRENQGRAEWTYRPGDHVLLRRDAGVQGKMQPLFDGPFEVVAVQEHGTLTLDKGRYLEKVHIRRVRPCKANRGGDCESAQ